MRAPQQSVITPAIMVLTIFFMLLGLSNAGIGNFGVVALMSGYGVSFSTGQYCADGVSRRQRGRRAGRRLSRRPHPAPRPELPRRVSRSTRPSMLVIATVTLPSLLLTAAMAAAGFLGGVIAPSRDMLVRNAAPPGAAGRAFGIVSTGFNLQRHLQPAAVRLDHGPEHAALGVRRLRRLHGPDGAAGAGHRPQAAGRRRRRLIPKQLDQG